MSAKLGRVIPSSSPSSSGYHIVNDSSPGWLPGGPWGLTGNHEDPNKDIWTVPLEGKCWGECRDMLKSHDKRALDDWRDEINTQLLVSSLLAAVTGGFVVESQKHLSEDPAVISAVVLLQIVRQLNESIAIPATELMAFGGPSRVERAFNSLFYASLGLSLANVTLGLLCLQWIRGMKNEPPGLDGRKYCITRYARYLGFEKWGAKAIISAQPLLLLSALLAFFVGLLVMASDSDWISSIPLYIILPSVAVIVVFTTVVPGLVIVLNSAFRKGYDFPSMPPFRSLQSWIAMQGFIYIFQTINRVLKLNPFGAFLSFQKCLDWTQLDVLWSGWANFYVEDSMLFPLILSTGTAEDMNTISNVLEETIIFNVKPEIRKLTILQTLVTYGDSLPATTQGSIVGLFLGELAGLINVGVSIDTLSNAFDSEEMICVTSAPLDSVRQLVNSLSFLCRTTNPSLEGFWNLFWKGLADLAQCSLIMTKADVGPLFFNDVFDSMQIALENPSTDTHTVFQRGFKSFIKALAYEVEQDRGWAQATAHLATLSVIISHPIWIPARRIITTLPSGEHTTAAQECLRTLDRIRQMIPPTPTPTPPTEPSTPSGGSVGEEDSSAREDDLSTTSSHIAIDFEHKHDHDDVTSIFVAPPVVTGVTELETDEDTDEVAGGTEAEMAFDQERPAMTMVSPFTLPTPPIDSSTLPTSPPGLPPQ